MSLKDKLELVLKPDAPYRPDNLPETEPARSRTLNKRAGRKRAAPRATPAVKRVRSR
jgi:hypothetical protein